MSLPALLTLSVSHRVVDLAFPVKDAIMHDMDICGSDPHPFRLGIFPVPGFAIVSYACTVEPLRAAHLLARRTLYDVVHFAADGQAQSSGAASIAAACRIGETPDLD